MRVTYGGVKLDIFTDNHECEKILMERGILSEIKKSIDPDAGFASGLYEGDRDCWIVIQHWSGFDAPEDNGWGLAMIEKTHCSRVRARKFFEKLTIAMAEGGGILSVVSQTIKPKDPLS